MVFHPISIELAHGGVRQASLSTGELTTTTGFQFHVRLAQEQDVVDLAVLFDGVTAEDRRFRFLSSVDNVSHVQLALLTHADEWQGASHIALDPVIGCILASALLALDGDGIEQRLPL